MMIIYFSSIVSAGHSIQNINFRVKIMNSEQCGLTLLSKLVLSAVIFYIISNPMVSASKSKNRTETGEVGIMKKNRTNIILSCIQCSNCEVGVIVVDCKPAQICFSYTELSQRL